MRRKEKQIQDMSALEEILKKAQICRIAMYDGKAPYIVPMNFGYKDGALYFHSAKEGRKIDILKQNPMAGFEIETDIELIKGERACDWGMKFISVIGHGEVSFIDRDSEKVAALDAIMEKYAGPQKFEYNPKTLEATQAFKLEIIEMTGKKSGY